MFQFIQPVQKILDYFAVTDTDELPEIEQIKHGGGPGYEVLKVGGRPVIVSFCYEGERKRFKTWDEQAKFDKERNHVIKISKARFVDYRIASGRAPHAWPTKYYPEPLSDKDREALFRFYESLETDVKTERRDGNLIIIITPRPSPHPDDPGEVSPPGIKPEDCRPR